MFLKFAGFGFVLSDAVLWILPQNSCFAYCCVLPGIPVCFLLRPACTDISVGFCTGLYFLFRCFFLFVQQFFFLQTKPNGCQNENHFMLNSLSSPMQGFCSRMKGLRLHCLVVAKFRVLSLQTVLIRATAAATAAAAVAAAVLLRYCCLLSCSLSLNYTMLLCFARQICCATSTEHCSFLF